MSHSQNNSLSIVLVISITMAATEAFLLMLLSILNTLVVLSQASLILTLPKMENAPSEDRSQLDMSDSAATTSLKVMRQNLPKEYTMLVPFLSLTRSLLASRTTRQESTP